MSASKLPALPVNRNIVTLMAAQLVGITGITSIVTLGGIVGATLAPSPAWATLPVACMVVGTAAATVAAAYLMAKVGRARGFAAGAVIGAIGHLTAAAAMATSGFWLLCAGAALVGVANAFAHQYRFAAIESVSPDAAGHAVSLVLIGSLGGAFIGPMLAAGGEDWIADAPFAGCFLVLAAGAFAAALAVAQLRPAATREATARATPRPLAKMARQPLFLAAVIGGAAGYGVMIFVMTATPLSMHAVDGHSLDSAASVVQAHVVAMYLPSLVTGFLVGRLGVGRLMAIGVCALAVTLALAFAGREVLHYGASMVMLGVGWNFLFVGGTVLLARAHHPAERFRAQAVNDFSVFGMSAAGSLSAGLVLHAWGWHGVLVAAMLPIAVATATLAIVRPGRWPIAENVRLAQAGNP